LSPGSTKIAGIGFSLKPDSSVLLRRRIADRKGASAK
jgi:hypothetical protein